ncbi:MAG: alpha/beta fold hydrolase [Ignavibacteriaceae bacterium]
MKIRIAFNPIIIVFLLIFSHPIIIAQDETSKDIQDIKKQNENLRHRLDVLEKKIDDVLWFHRIGDVAYIDKVFLAGPPLWKEKNPDAQGAGNPTKFWTYIFIPKDLDLTKKYPLIVLSHGGVHANFTTYHTHIIKELMAQQYIVVAPEYRGSTGYGKDHYQKIDYGGLEVEDVDSSRNYMIANYDFVDASRVGLLGWSHGGLIALMNIFRYPDNYKVAFAGVPVSDLIARMGYKDQSYRDLFEADYHIGQSADDNVEEYRRRSPVWHAEKLQTPLLIHTNTNDEDVNVLEVEHLISALKAADKEFEYEIFQDLPGGHSFDRLDTKKAKEIRVKIYNFINKYLNPPNPIKSVEDINRAAYLPH